MSSEERLRLTKIAERIAPRDAAIRHKRLFDEREYDLLDDEGSYKDQRARLDEKRRAALLEIHSNGGDHALLAFAARVDSPGALGWVLGTMSEIRDDLVLPAFLDSADPSKKRLAQAFVAGRAHAKGLSWVDGIDRTGWSHEVIATFLCALRFTSSTWERVARFLGDREALYWRTCEVNAFAADSGLEEAADKLVAHGRPRAAVDCLVALEHEKQTYDRRLATRVLLASAASAEPAGNLDTYHLRQIISALQVDPTLDENDVAKVEMAYIILLDRDDKARPVVLERKLAADPTFFMDLIRLIYRSKLETKPRELTERDKTIAQAAYHILRAWTKLPGTKGESVDAEALKKWVREMKLSASASGHLEIAMLQLGETFAHAPPDPTGFWLDRTVATILNERDADAMRDGFRTELYNKRGVVGFTAETAGDAEEKLASAWRARAAETEQAGFPRLAEPLRELADGYEEDAKLWRSDPIFK